MTAWYTVALLTVLLIFSTIDRTILALLAAPASKSLNLSDAQMGLVIGLGFAVLYALAGLPLAHWIDTKTRRTLIAVGVVLWSAMTVASAFAYDFASLMICRAGVAIGEAVLSPAAISMIGDMFARDKRALPVSVFASIPGIFGSGSFIVGAGVLAIATPLSARTSLAPWQMTLILVGMPGILLGFLFLVTVKEPPRIEQHSLEHAGTRAFLRYLRVNWFFYLPFMWGVAAICVFSYAQIAWLVTVLIRDHGLELPMAGLFFGAAGVLGAIVGTLIIPQLTARLERARPLYGVPITQLALSVLILPFMTVTPISSDMLVLLLGTFVTMICISCWAVMMPLGIQTFGPSRLRARLMAVYLLAGNLIGLSIGPIAAVYLGELWTSRPLAHGIAATGMIVGPILVACCLLVYRAVPRMSAGDGGMALR